MGEVGLDYGVVRDENTQFIRGVLQWAISTSSRQKATTHRADLANLSWLEDFGDSVAADDPAALSSERRRLELLYKFDPSRYVLEATIAVELVVPNSI